MPETTQHLPVYVKSSLLDRLTAPADDYLTGTRRPPEAEEGGGIKADAYRDTVLRDLEWMFNAASPLGLADSDMRRKYPHVAASVLGYGLRGIFGCVVHNTDDIEKHVEKALATFEPRLVVEEMSLKISQEGQLIEIEINGILLTQHAKRHLWIRTDLETLGSKVRTDNNG